MNAVTSPMHADHGNADRMGSALLFSLMLHAIFILGVGFGFAKPAPSLPTLDVTLVNTASGEQPGQPDFLAQTNNTGGGESQQARRPGAPFSGPLPVVDAGVAPAPVLPAAPAPQAASGPHLLTTRGKSEVSVATEQDTRAAPTPAERQSPIPVEQRLEMARLSQEVREEQQSYARQPRRKYVSASTRSVAYAAYQVAWVHRIERIGNLNYPDAARRRRLHGEVVLTVMVGADGRVRGVTVNRSSGYPVLDEAATRIVHLAAPFEPLPKDHDARGRRITELAITRSWQFLPGDQLRTRGTGSR